MRLLRATAAVLVALVCVSLVAGLWVRQLLVGSLPTLDGELPVAGLNGAVTITRDDLGVPSVRGGTATDVALALGFLHGQERYFGMDALRRYAAGELAELLGEPALPSDLQMRRHRFRSVARRALANLPETERTRLRAYARGVNAGLAALRVRPFEYLLLRASPMPWREEDSVLVNLGMFAQLVPAGDSALESARGLVRELLPPALADFLDARGTEWDAPLVGQAFATPPVPGPKDLGAPSSPAPAAGGLMVDPLPRASNAWAIGGALTAHAGAMLASDPHMDLGVPNVLYRVLLAWPAEDGSPRQLVGLTVPGAPVVVIGSNGRVAWGMTQSLHDVADLILLEDDPARPGHYRSPEGLRPLEREAETIHVKGGAEVKAEWEATAWGPVIDRDHKGRRRVLRWTAHDPEAVNFHMLELEEARTVADALAVASRSGIVSENFVCADRDGHVGWTIMGRIPRRVGFVGRVPTSWADGRRRWDGLLPPAAHPRIVDPPGGRIWTANARVVDGEALATLGDGGYVLGARARQIREDLFARERFSERDMLAVQLDDRALFLARWQRLLLDTLAPSALQGNARRVALRRLVERWGARASVDSAGYAYVRAFRRAAAERALGPLVAVCKAADPQFSLAVLQTEGALWRLVQERPSHLLPPGIPSWDQLLLAAADDAVRAIAGDELALERHTWGARNRASIRHVMSDGLPALFGRFLDMPPDPLPGDSSMPRVQGPSDGAAARLVVSPGREDRGILHMPAGQLDHPLSPFYGAGHRAWVRGEPTPLLPGATRHTLRLLPAGTS